MRLAGCRFKPGMTFYLFAAVISAFSVKQGRFFCRKPLIADGNVSCHEWGNIAKYSEVHAVFWFWRQTRKYLAG